MRRRVSIQAAEGLMRRRILILMAIATALVGCAPDTVQDLAPTKAHFLGHRVEYETLIAKIQLCDEPRPTHKTRILDRECSSGKTTLREIRMDMKRLGLKDASWSEDYSQIELVNGDDGTELGVMSSLVRYATPQDDPRGDALTPAPHHWFYTQHD